MNFFLVILLLMFSNLLNAQNAVLYGFIKEKTTGENLVGANLVVEETGVGITSNQYGFYSITLPYGTYHLKYSFIGYKPLVVNVSLKKDSTLTVELEQFVKQLDIVNIVAGKTNNVISNEMGSHALDLHNTKNIPSPGGEPDVIKIFQLLPGVQVANEGTTNLSVRGGSFDQNLFLLDGAPVYNPSHALGFFSVFNTDAIKSAKMYKSYYPAQYGGRLSSIVDIQMKEGNAKSTNAEGGVGLLASRLTIAMPVIKEKVSFMVSGRYSYTGQTVNTLGSIGQQLQIGGLEDFNNKNEISFYDLNAKMNWVVNNKNKIYLSGYSGNDHFYYYAIDNSNIMDWGNFTGTLRWNRVHNSRLFSNTTAIYSKYAYANVLRDDVRNFKWSANLSEMDVKTDFDFYANTQNHLKFGYVIEKHNYEPGRIEPRDTTSITKPFDLTHQQTVVGDLYVNNEQKLNDNFSLSYGLRYSTFFLLGSQTVYSYSAQMEPIDSLNYGRGDLVQFYHSLEPRVVLNYLFKNNNSIKLSFSRVSQYQHLLSNSTVGLPTDVWIPSNSYIKPQKANQVSIGYYKVFNHSGYEFSVESYYRKLYNVIDYRDNANLFLNSHIETQILAGSGKSYGVEFLLEKKSGRLNGWLGYTLGHTTRQIEGINQGASYSVTYDKRHNLTAVGLWEITPQWSLSSIFKVTSGGFVTLPEGMFYYKGASFNYYYKRNGYELPLYHRLDLSFRYNSRKNNLRRVKLEWDMGIYNLYGRKNIFSLFVKQSSTYLTNSRMQMMYLYGITPYVTLNFKY